jgi:hypothetical protein
MNRTREREGRLVRIAGWVLLVGGFLLCASIAWAALGFLLMGVGLISLLVAEQNRNRAKLAAKPTLASRTGSPAAAPEIPAGLLQAAQVPGGTATVQPGRADPYHDAEAWRRLVESDSDFSWATSVLQEYGQPYVDELARTYLAAGDRSKLPAIVDAIIRKAKRSLARRNAASQASAAPGIERPSRAFDGPLGQASPISADPIGGTEETRPVEGPFEAAPIAEAFVDPQAPITAQRTTTIISADDDLSRLIGMFAPESSFRHKH